MPLEGLRWSRDSGSALYDTPKNGRSRTGWGGGDNSSHLQYTFYALRILNNSVRIFIGKRDSKNIKSKWQQTE